jgi:hypothetical protein
VYHPPPAHVKGKNAKCAGDVAAEHMLVVVDGKGPTTVVDVSSESTAFVVGAL